MSALSENTMPSVHSAQRLIDTFARCFSESQSTELVGGAEEPLYEPAAQPGAMHRLYFREDYFASALHEASHWCIAGKQRRLQRDFGYWYAPDGRTPAQQAAFESVEYKPQALEWMFCLACNYPFHISFDNLDATQSSVPEAGPFTQRIYEQARHWQQHGLPPRGAVFFQALSAEFGTYLMSETLRLEVSDLR